MSAKRYYVDEYYPEPGEDGIGFVKVDTEVVLASDYATLEAECRWAMEWVIKTRRYLAETQWLSEEAGKRALSSDPDYQRANAWLLANQ